MSIQYIYELFLMWVMVTKCCLGNMNVILVQTMDYKGERPGNEAILVMYYSDKVSSVK